MISLILGGARSGKSSYAEAMAIASKKEVIYIATGEARDDEMRDRIIHHQNSRPAQWLTIEEPIELASVLKTQAQSEGCLLVDCLTLWLSNILFDRQGEMQEAVFNQQKTDLLACLTHLKGDVIFVSNEVGCGIVPMDKMSRRFVDEAGRLHQQLAECCDSVVLVTAGLPQVLK
ncbi:MAG: bifunctional adenosylcobinamide kinase/adenosylcobinamide-phosphate guanylyltransferase [Methylococcaceae bacterium]|nr:bifunctional adenosylcobinamide kinase/adenosylcobinamide-phosphate guanylyltransferase [Methylococcaceae bacterium]